MGQRLRQLGFDTLVLCAEEHQPPGRAFPGVEVIHLPFDDTVEPMDYRQYGAIQKTADRVARRLRARRRVLVTCHAGLNRSGLVNALALMRATGAPPSIAIERIRARRGVRALSNPYFESLVRRAHGGGAAKAWAEVSHCCNAAISAR